MKRYFWSLAELRTLLYGAYPEMAQVKWVDESLRDVERIQAMVRGASAVSYWTWYWACFESFRSLN